MDCIYIALSQTQWPPKHFTALWPWTNITRKDNRNRGNPQHTAI